MRPCTAYDSYSHNTHTIGGTMTANHEHTPSTRGVRSAYLRVWNGSIEGANAETVAAEFDRWHQAELAAAEQRGAERALREAAGAIEKNQIMTQVGHLQPCNSCMVIHVDFLDYRADQMEGDDE